MKKRILILSLTTLISVGYVFPGFAQNIGNDVPNPVSMYEQNMNESRNVIKQPRGSYISTGILTISNPGDGEIGVSMINIAHQDVDETSFHINLDRWIESEKRWANIDSYDFVYNKENCPGENLTEKSVSFHIVGQPADCYYRLRGIHRVTVGDKQETLSSETDGLLITK